MEKKSLRDISHEYDQQFKDSLKKAKLLIKYLQSKKEQRLAKKWLSRVSNIKSSALDVKKNRNAFLSYLMKVLINSVRNEHPEVEPGTISDDTLQDYLDECGEFSDFNQEENEIPERFHSKWSEDQRTYVAVQPIPGRGALVYMAVSKNPGIKNWDLPSLKGTQT